ncbi:reverse transcriptase, partial [Golovinomyces cichoracearum]
EDTCDADYSTSPPATPKPNDFQTPRTSASWAQISTTATVPAAAESSSILHQKADSNAKRPSLHTNLSKIQHVHNQKQSNTQTQDNRLLIRLSSSHKARSTPGYTVLSGLIAILGDVGKHIIEVQATRMGFALRPLSPDSLSVIKELGPSIRIFSGSDCQNERLKDWKLFRLSNVPQKITTINKSGQIYQCPVSHISLKPALEEAIGISPEHIFETASSFADPHNFFSRWIIGIPFESKTPLRYPYSSNPHNCPPRYFHYHGPHATDSLECLFRPSATGNSPDKSQIAKIRKTCAEALIALCIEAGCGSNKNGSAKINKSTEPPKDMELVLATPDVNSSTSTQPHKSRKRTRCSLPSLAVTRGAFAPLEKV